ncbi:hypothetical protein [Evansella cellulosilytica]|uniref:DUF4252 domain-containing protein n=1 Tax=Evansella cellulosilytica (strain ATCC 21833 / DSM 2522 / FERM P-1141 / JCM 9156 / N-4) TaxID=649639 RepID=E6U184_EVAC2|nr:hypothetical protein [Evansella cellulosilytica]ADU31530.1 hypothetical protein Bcell_3288 [Evansella cellulosilytica DSM 2522]
MDLKWLVKSSLLVIMLVLIVSGCSISKEDAQQFASNSFASKLEQEAKSATHELDDISLYIPSYTTVEEIDEFNVLLERSNHILLLFLNDIVENKTKEGILETLLIEDDPFIFESGETTEGNLAYLVVTELEEDMYSVIVGYNGYKITTLSSLSDMNNISEMMFDIVRSIEEK